MMIGTDQLIGSEGYQMELILAFDTETGGLDPAKTSLLTAYFVILNENLEAIDELELQIRTEKNEPYSVTSQALEINKINLAELSAKGITKDVARLRLNDFLSRHSNGKTNTITPMAHNLAFDMGFIQAHLLPKEIWDTHVDYHTLDTAGIATFLRRKGKLPKNLSTSLKSLAKHFKLDLSKGDLHTSRFDTVLMVAVYEAMEKL
jgi:DNA polymerase III epsilon subunit-like protein